MREVAVSGVVPQAKAAPADWKVGRNWIGWTPLLVLPLLVLALRAKLLPWIFMWVLAIAIFAGCKWQTWWEASAARAIAPELKRSLAYLLLWLGMDPQEFFDAAVEKRHIPVREWIAAAGAMLTGIALIWIGVRLVVSQHPMSGGWAGMLGLVLVLHFGIFHLIALAWRRAGLSVTPIMQRPLASRSLTELWGRRWNLGYRAISHKWVFQPLQKRWGAAAGTLGAFLASGLLHEMVISVPARAGYGLPTAYFFLQGLGCLAERREAGKRLGMGRGIRGWLWTAAIALGPVYALFHPWFVMRVIVPFLRAISR